MFSDSCPTHVQGLAGARAAATDAAGWPHQAVVRGSARKLGRQPPQLGRGELLRGALHVRGQQVVHLAQAARGLGHGSQGCIQDPCIPTTCGQCGTVCNWNSRQYWVTAATMDGIPAVNVACWQMRESGWAAGQVRSLLLEQLLRALSLDCVEARRRLSHLGRQGGLGCWNQRESCACWAPCKHRKGASSARGLSPGARDTATPQAPCKLAPSHMRCQPGRLCAAEE